MNWKMVRTRIRISLWLLSTLPGLAAEFDQSHGKLDAVLSPHVHGGWVGYAVRKGRPGPLVEYLDHLASVRESDFNRWPETERLAFQIKLYNATTLKLIIDHYPLASIKDIGGFFKGPWKQDVVRLFGNVTTLGVLEHEIIRRQYRDARAHFALACAARGCPSLRSEANVASRLDEQLEDQARAFPRQIAKNRVDARSRTLYL